MVHIFSLCFLLLSNVILPAIFPGEVFAQQTSPSSYELALSFSTENTRLTGTAKISVAAGEDLTLSLHGLRVTGAFVRYDTGSETIIQPGDEALMLPKATSARTVYISYEKIAVNDYNNLISNRGISLTNNWYPRPLQPHLFSISAELPSGFTAITESDRFPLATTSNISTSTWSRPATDISFVAGPYKLSKRKVRDDLFVYSMFFEEDKDLAKGYLDAAAGYIQTFEKTIAPFPYNHYVIVANRLPTGYGMPSFTLLGQMVLRLPFIQTSSLGHEIVHSWFGNDVEVDFNSGNWCEGLTSFLADHSFRAEEGKGVEDRKASLIKYNNYIQGTSSPISLEQFSSASHNQPLADAKRAVGYNAGAFFFHELRERLGQDIFSAGIKDFYNNNSGTTASWDDIQSSFERVSGDNLQSFFHSRLTMTTPPEISATDIHVTSKNGIYLHFTLRGEIAEGTMIKVPIHVTTMSEVFVFTEELTTATKKVSLLLSEMPLSFTLDPEYTLLRTLSDEERSPVWSQFLGAKKKLIVLAKEKDRPKYRAILDSLLKYEPTVVLADEVTNQMLSENNLLFLGPDQKPCRSIFGTVSHKSDSFTVDVRKNPLHQELVAVMISDNRSTPEPSVARRLQHYGKYSRVIFHRDGSVNKDITPAANGIRYELERLPAGGATSDLSSFDHIIEQLLKKRVIYLGETHTSLPDHLLQLRIIEALYMYDENLAIGMEMFPVSSQKSLDEFTQAGSTMDERRFLKESDYFNVWGYDYRLFRNTLNFAKDNNLMVKGLNLDRKIVSDVFRAGNTDGLSDEVKSELVPDRNLDLPGYQARLATVHKAHTSAKTMGGAASGFIQSQALWDETMAASIVSFLKEYPDHRMVVIAGNQHTRKDSGIPPRVSARIPVSQASVINIYDGSSQADLEKTADFFFLADYKELPQSPKIGLVLREEKENGSAKGLIIDQISPHGKAGEAGLKVGDILTRLGNAKIEDMTDLKIAMVDAQAGDTLEIEILRGKNLDKRHIFEVELTIPQMPQGHP